MAYTTIKKPSEHFNTNLYTANGTGKTITGMDFQPDFVWTKNRDNTSYIPALVDAVRGGTKKVFSNNTDAESTDANAITAFNSDGYTFGSSGSFNFGTDDYVNWCWKGANGTASNTDGSITSTVSANTTSGFSIVSYTGTGANATVGHGLGVAPKFIIIKNLVDAVNWEVGHNSIGWTKKLRLNTTATETVDNGAFNDTAPTSSVFSLGNNGTSNGSGDSMIAYCFAEIQGFSKFGVYSGNGNADGPFVYTGFKPAFIMIKDGDNLENWFMFDSKRPGYNVNANLLYANDSASETTSGANQIDILSNGFKMRATNNGTNRSGGEGFNYIAFAEEPLVGDNPATAR